MENRALIETYLAARNARDRTRLAEVLSEDVVYLVPSSLGVDPRHGETAIEALAGAGAAKFFDLSTMGRKVRRITEADEVVLVEERLTAKALNGNDYDNEYVWVLEVRDGKIVRVVEHVDTLYAARTLGIPS